MRQRSGKEWTHTGEIVSLHIPDQDVVWWATLFSEAGLDSSEIKERLGRLNEAYRLKNWQKGVILFDNIVQYIESKLKRPLNSEETMMLMKYVAKDFPEIYQKNKD